MVKNDCAAPEPLVAATAANSFGPVECLNSQSLAKLGVATRPHGDLGDLDSPADAYSQTCTLCAHKGCEGLSAMTLSPEALLDAPLSYTLVQSPVSFPEDRPGALVIPFQLRKSNAERIIAVDGLG